MVSSCSTEVEHMVVSEFIAEAILLSGLSEDLGVFQIYLSLCFAIQREFNLPFNN